MSSKMRSRKVSKLTLAQQLERFLNNPLIPKYFTRDLYEAMYVRGSFIAHFNRDGFYRARFLTLSDLDYTLTCMLQVKELSDLLDEVGCEVIARARYNIASHEASILRIQAANVLDKVNQLQNKFEWKI